MSLLKNHIFISLSSTTKSPFFMRIPAIMHLRLPFAVAQVRFCMRTVRACHKPVITARFHKSTYWRQPFIGLEYRGKTSSAETLRDLLKHSHATFYIGWIRRVHEISGRLHATSPTVAINFFQIVLIIRRPIVDGSELIARCNLQDQDLRFIGKDCFESWVRN